MRKKQNTKIISNLQTHTHAHTIIKLSRTSCTCVNCVHSANINSLNGDRTFSFSFASTSPVGRYLVPHIVRTTSPQDTFIDCSTIIVNTRRYFHNSSIVHSIIAGHVVCRHLAVVSR